MEIESPGLYRHPDIVCVPSLQQQHGFLWQSSASVLSLGYGETQPLVSLVFSRCIALLSRGLATGGVGPVPVPTGSFVPILPTTSCLSVYSLAPPPHLCPAENPRESLVLQVSLWLWRSLLSASVFPLGWSRSSALETWRSSGGCARLGRGISPSYRGSPEILPSRELCRLSTY